MNKIVGLVGEDPNDTLSIKNLLLQRYKNVTYVQLIKHIKGYHPDQPKTKKSLQIEFERRKFDVIIFVRDADGICTETNKIKKVESWYRNLSEAVTCKKTLLLNIYELEALIFADINTFNDRYKVSIKGNRDVMYIKEPKEELKNKTDRHKKKYSVSDCPEIFEVLNIDVVSKNCTYFKAFLEEFAGRLDTQKI